MPKRIFSGILLSLLLMGMLTVAFNIQPVKAQPSTIIVPDDYPTEFSRINLTSNVTMEEAIVGGIQVAHADITVLNVLNFTLYNVTVRLEASGYGIAPSEVDIDFGDIPTNQTQLERYYQDYMVNEMQYVKNVTLIEAFGYEDMRMPSIISVQVSTATVTIGRSTNITGSITPILAGVDITIYYKYILESNWGTLATVATNENGTYSREWTPPWPGTWQLKANWTGDENTQPAEASITLDCVKIVTAISISTNASSTIVGFRVTITGRLTDEYGNGLTSEPVVLYYTSYGVNTWNLITSVATDAFGNYSAMWIPNATGTFTIEARWDANLTYVAASNDVTLISLPYQNQYVFSVESNSTVSDLVFDTSKNILSFSVSGENDTSGCTRVTMAKSLIVDATKLDVRIDGNPYNYALTETNDSWVLTFTYEHSSHTVEIDLEKALVPEFSNDLILFLLTTLAVAVLVLVAEKKRTLKSAQQQKPYKF